MIWLLAIPGYVLLAFATWIFYLAIMMLKANEDTLPKTARYVGYVVLSIGYVLDVAFNLASSLLFLELPRELLFTGRVSRLKKGAGWRADLAHWFCANLLNPIDPGHCG